MRLRRAAFYRIQQYSAVHGRQVANQSQQKIEGQRVRAAGIIAVTANMRLFPTLHGNCRGQRATEACYRSVLQIRYLCSDRHAVNHAVNDEPAPAKLTSAQEPKPSEEDPVAGSSRSFAPAGQKLSVLPLSILPAGHRPGSPFRIFSPRFLRQIQGVQTFAPTLYPAGNGPHLE
jgi:hypothetical protein